MNISILLCPRLLMSLFAYLFVIISVRPFDVKCVIKLMCWLSAFKLGSLCLMLEIHERRLWVGKQSLWLEVCIGHFIPQSCMGTAPFLTSDLSGQAKLYAWLNGCVKTEERKLEIKEGQVEFVFLYSLYLSDLQRTLWGKWHYCSHL